MGIKQLTVFVENRCGSLAKVTDLLAEHQIDIRALSLADTKEFGLLRLIVNQAETACSVLRENGILVQITEVMGVKLSDRPGELSDVLSALDEAKMNVEYLYAFLTRTEKSAYVVLRVEDNTAATDVLTKAGFGIVSEKDVEAL